MEVVERAEGATKVKSALLVSGRCEVDVFVRNCAQQAHQERREQVDELQHCRLGADSVKWRFKKRTSTYPFRLPARVAREAA